jgi:hypothetical protein
MNLAMLPSSGYSRAIEVIEGAFCPAVFLGQPTVIGGTAATTMTENPVTGNDRLETRVRGESCINAV